MHNETISERKKLNYIRVIYSGISTTLLNQYCTRCAELHCAAKKTAPFYFCNSFVRTSSFM